MSAAVVETAPRRRRVPWWVWVIATACLIWLCLALYGQLIREKVIADPVKVEHEQKAKAAAEAGEPLPNTVQALGDMDLPPERPAPVNASDDRGVEVLRVSERKCAKLNTAFQAKVVGPGQCEVYLHELNRQDGMIMLMASPKFGVRENGRPVITILPESAYPAR
jgi:hypothetical protein